LIQIIVSSLSYDDFRHNLPPSPPKELRHSLAL
jgi:hypothetical protein